MRPYSERRESVIHMLEVQGFKYNPDNEESRNRFNELMNAYEAFEEMYEKSQPKKSVVEPADLKTV